MDALAIAAGLRSSVSRGKSPSATNGASEAVDVPGLRPDKDKKGSLSSLFVSPKKFKKIFKKTSHTDLPPQPSKGDRHELSPTASKGSAHEAGSHSEDPESSLSGQTDPSDRATSPEDNFFSFAAGDENIWDDKVFTSSLRIRTYKRLSLDNQLFTEAKPLLEEDTSVDNIGVTYVETERESKIVEKEVQPRGQRHTSPAPAVVNSTKTRSKTVSVPFQPAALETCSLPMELGRPRTNTDSFLLSDSSKSSPSKPEATRRISHLVCRVEELEEGRWKAPPVKETVDRILLGKLFCLEWYKSATEKRALLDAAIDTYDGNCITTILVFIRKTVNQSILLGMLVKRPIATHHYANFLRQLGAQKELEHLYMRMDNYESLSNFKLNQCELELDPIDRVSKIKSCHLMYKSTPQLQADAYYVDEYARLTERQKHIEDSVGRGGDVVLRPGSVLFRPVLTTLLYCCRYHRDKPETNTASPVAFRQLFSISEKQYFQMYLLALSIDQDWEGIDALVTIKGFMSKKKKSPIGWERVVNTLAKQNLEAPSEVVSKYLAEIEDLELRLQLATEVRVFDVALECLKLLKDKERLKNYINFIPSNKHWEYRKKIEALANNSHIRWK